MQQAAAVATRRAAYLAAMTRFAAFVVEGSDTVPINKKGDPVGGFVDPTTRSDRLRLLQLRRQPHKEACAAIPGPNLGTRGRLGK